MRNRIIVAVLGIPVLLTVLLVLPPIYTPVATAFLVIVASYEVGRAFEIKQIFIQIGTMLLAGAIPFWVYFDQPALVARCALFLYVFMIFCIAFSSHYKVDIAKVGGLFFFSILVPYFLSAIVRIGMNPLRSCYILVPLAIPFLSDASAMFSGILFGKHKLAPEISPKKTVEGSIGGVVGSVLGILLYGFVISLVLGAEVNYLYLAIYGLLGAGISQVGDLSFSYVKRQRVIKDFGSIFPGHGGVLDRFDSVIFCAPVIELLIVLLPAFQMA